MVKAYIETEISRFENGWLCFSFSSDGKSSNCKRWKKLIKDKVYFPGYVMINKSNWWNTSYYKGITSVMVF
jgi:transcriptional antiterminator NusG